MLDIYYPYLLDYGHLNVEQAIIFAVSALLAVMVSAEGQAFMAALLGDARPGARDRFHYNVFLHMSLLGSLSFLVAGFGWSREMTVDSSRFKRPRLGLLVSRLAGPLSNLLLASIAGSLNWILSTYGVVDQVFAMITVCNVTMAIYSLLPIPPLPGGVLLFVLLPQGQGIDALRRCLQALGPYLLLGFFAAVRLSEWSGLDNLLTPVVKSISKLILG